MDIEKFINDRPFLYHLTCKENAINIIAQRQLFSANELIRKSKNKDYLPIKRNKRRKHQEIVIDGVAYFLRDQRPISEINLAKCLTDGWEIGDYLNYLNNRVFMWPTKNRLWPHFNRYKKEKPVIFRFSTGAMFEANPHVMFCRLNSGATRSNSNLDGAPPERGPNIFLSARDFERPVRDVAEATFVKTCMIAGEFGYSYSPDKRFKSVVD